MTIAKYINCWYLGQGSHKLVDQGVVPVLFSLMASKHLTSVSWENLCTVLLKLSKQTRKFKELSYYVVILISIIEINLDKEMVGRLLYMSWENNVDLATWMVAFLEECSFNGE
jgi:hypothetical protein